MLVARYLPPRTIGFCLKRLKVPSYFPLTQYSRFPTKSRNPLRPTTKHLQFQANPLAQIRSSEGALYNYYGSGSLWSVSLAAIMFSILATLKRWNINPRLWLTWYLESCAAAGGKPPSEIASFLPWNLSDQRREELTGAVPPVASIDSS